MALPSIMNNKQRIKLTLSSSSSVPYLVCLYIFYSQLFYIVKLYVLDLTEKYNYLINKILLLIKYAYDSYYQTIFSNTTSD